jgi:hypothetical protein
MFCPQNVCDLHGSNQSNMSAQQINPFPEFRQPILVLFWPRVAGSTEGWGQ